MKIDRHNRQRRFTRVKPLFMAMVLFSGATGRSEWSQVAAQEPVGFVSTAASKTDSQRSQPEAVQLVSQVLELIVRGPAFDARVRETVWTAGREVLGLGTYLQAGGGTGRFNLQLTMVDGDGQFQQISDGRLAWTRTEIAGRVSLRRVDVGRLEEWVPKVQREINLPPRLLVGAWPEMLATFHRDYVLRLDTCTLRDQPMWVITGRLKDARRAEVLEQAGGTWPELYPSVMRIAVRREPEPESRFGQWLPTRIEFWSDPAGDTASNKTEPAKVANPANGQLSGADAASSQIAASPQQIPKGRLITLIELYSLRLIEAPPPEQFRFGNKNAEVDIVNETDRYIQQYGVELTERERLQLRR